MMRVKKCPHCGGKVLVGVNYLGQWAVMCADEKCGAVVWGKDKRDVVAKWNRKEVG